MVSNLALFCLATYLATFSKIGRFFPNHLVTLTRITNYTKLPVTPELPEIPSSVTRKYRLIILAMVKQPTLIYKKVEDGDKKFYNIDN